MPHPGDLGRGEGVGQKKPLCILHSAFRIPHSAAGQGFGGESTGGGDGAGALVVQCAKTGEEKVLFLPLINPLQVRGVHVPDARMDMWGGWSAMRERSRPRSAAAFQSSVFSRELALQRQGSDRERAGRGNGAGVFAAQGSGVRDGLVSIVRTDTGT